MFYRLIVSSLSLLAIFNSTSAYSETQFDHSFSSYDELLKKHVSVKGAVSQVDYKALKKDRAQLLNFNTQLSKVSQQEFDQWSPKQQQAFLINAYNSFTLQLIVDHYPVKSIKKIGGFFSSPWKKKFFSLLGQKTHLDHIEHGILRKKYDEPRVHFAVNCASIGCPALANFAFTAEKLNEQLDSQAKLFLRDGSRNTLNQKEKILRVSKIFDWFEEDFTKNGSTVAKFVAPYITEDKKLQKEIASGSYKVKYHSYDWNLNEK